jgi:PTH1 family peptidyl-tRNA hydrolase
MALVQHQSKNSRNRLPSGGRIRSKPSFGAGLVIVGLGNPGKEYEKTRHNAGRSAVELLAKQEGFDEFVFNKTVNALVAKGTFEGHGVSAKMTDTPCPSVSATLVLPETMMNLSGKAVASFIKSPKAAKNLLVIHDDLDLPLGTIKMVFARGSGGHKGVESIMRAIKTDAFARIRIGISAAGKKNQAKKVSGEEKVIKLVIGKWKPAEEAAVKKILKKAALAVRLFATEGIESATMFANTK